MSQEALLSGFSKAVIPKQDSFYVETLFSTIALWLTSEGEEKVIIQGLLHST